VVREPIRKDVGLGRVQARIRTNYLHRPRRRKRDGLLNDGEGERDSNDGEQRIAGREVYDAKNRERNRRGKAGRDRRAP